MNSSYQEVLKCTEFDIVKEIEDRIEYHRQKLEGQCHLYHHWMYSLQIITPLLSAVMTLLASGKFTWKHAELMTFLLGAAVTVLTVINSSLQPSVKYAFAKTFSNRFLTFRTQLRLELERIFETNKDEAAMRLAVNRLLTRKNSEIFKLIEDYNRGPAQQPEEPLKTAGETPQESATTPAPPSAETPAPTTAARAA